MGGIVGVKRAALLGGVGAALFAAAPASAQVFGWWGYQPFEYRYRVEENTPLSGGEVRGLLARQGYRLSGPLQRNGDVLLADVADRSGRQLRLIVDRYDGRVLQRFLNAEPRPPRGIPGAAREQQALATPDADETERPTSSARKPAQKPKPAVRTVPQKQAARPARQAPSDANRTPRVIDPVAAGANQAAPAPREPDVAAAPPASPRPAAPATDAPAPARPAAPAGPGTVNGVPNNPLD